MTSYHHHSSSNSSHHHSSSSRRRSSSVSHSSYTPEERPIKRRRSSDIDRHDDGHDLEITGLEEWWTENHLADFLYQAMKHENVLRYAGRPITSCTINRSEGLARVEIRSYSEARHLIQLQYVQANGRRLKIRPWSHSSSSSSRHRNHQEDDLTDDEHDEKEYYNEYVSGNRILVWSEKDKGRWTRSYLLRNLNEEMERKGADNAVIDVYKDSSNRWVIKVVSAVLATELRKLLKYKRRWWVYGLDGDTTHGHPHSSYNHHHQSSSQQESTTFQRTSLSEEAYPVLYMENLEKKRNRGWMLKVLNYKMRFHWEGDDPAILDATKLEIGWEVKVVNESVAKILKKMVDTHPSWIASTTPITSQMLSDAQASNAVKTSLTSTRNTTHHTERQPPTSTKANTVTSYASLASPQNKTRHSESQPQSEIANAVNTSLASPRKTTHSPSPSPSAKADAGKTPLASPSRNMRGSDKDSNNSTDKNHHDDSSHNQRQHSPTFQRSSLSEETYPVLYIRPRPSSRPPNRNWILGYLNGQMRLRCNLKDDQVVDATELEACWEVEVVNGSAAKSLKEMVKHFTGWKVSTTPITSQMIAAHPVLYVRQDNPLHPNKNWMVKNLNSKMRSHWEGGDAIVNAMQLEYCWSVQLVNDAMAKTLKEQLENSNGWMISTTPITSQMVDAAQAPVNTSLASPRKMTNSPSHSPSASNTSTSSPRNTTHYSPNQSPSAMTLRLMAFQRPPGSTDVDQLMAFINDHVKERFVTNSQQPPITSAKIKHGDSLETCWILQASSTVARDVIVDMQDTEFQSTTLSFHRYVNLSFSNDQDDNKDNGHNMRRDSKSYSPSHRDGKTTIENDPSTAPKSPGTRSLRQLLTPITTKTTSRRKRIFSEMEESQDLSLHTKSGDGATHKHHGGKGLDMEEGGDESTTVETSSTTKHLSPGQILTPTTSTGRSKDFFTQAEAPSDSSLKAKASGKPAQRQEGTESDMEESDDESMNQTSFSKHPPSSTEPVEKTSPGDKANHQLHAEQFDDASHDAVEYVSRKDQTSTARPLKKRHVEANDEGEATIMGEENNNASNDSMEKPANSDRLSPAGPVETRTDDEASQEHAESTVERNKEASNNAVDNSTQEESTEGPSTRSSPQQECNNSTTARENNAIIKVDPMEGDGNASTVEPNLVRTVSEPAPPPTAVAPSPSPGKNLACLMKQKAHMMEEQKKQEEEWDRLRKALSQATRQYTNEVAKVKTLEKENLTLAQEKHASDQKFQEAREVVAGTVEKLRIATARAAQSDERFKKSQAESEQLLKAQFEEKVAATREAEKAKNELERTSEELETTKGQLHAVHESWQEQAVELQDMKQQLADLKAELQQEREMRDDMDRRYRGVADSLALQATELVEERRARRNLEEFLIVKRNDMQN